MLLELTGQNLYKDKIVYQTGSLDVKELLQLYLTIRFSNEERLKEESLVKFWKHFLNGDNLVDIEITNITINKWNGLELTTNVDARLSLYAISRARI